MNCPQCGALNESRDSFCADCGYSFATPMKIVRSEDKPFSPAINQQSSKQKQNTGKFLLFWLVSTIIIFLLVLFLFQA